MSALSRIVNEALWEASRLWSLRLSVADQVHVVELLTSEGKPITADAVRSAFAAAGLRAPTRACAETVARRVRQLEQGVRP